MQTDRSSDGPLEHGSLREWLAAHTAEIDAVVFDVDGVLMKAHAPLPGSRELIEWLRGAGLPFTLLTNDGCHSPEEKTAALRQCGLDFTLAEIVSSSHGLEELVAAQGWGGALFYVMGDLGTPCYAERAGVRVTRDRADLPEVTGVIVGEKDYDWQRAITAVVNRIIQHPQTPLIVPNPDVFFPGREGWLHLASGAVARFVAEAAAGYGLPVAPVYLGKPFRPIFEYNHHRLERRLNRSLERSRVLMVGDFLPSDIRGGLDFGYRTGLVLTGITTRELLARSSFHPELVFEGL